MRAVRRSPNRGFAWARSASHAARTPPKAMILGGTEIVREKLAPAARSTGVLGVGAPTAQPWPARSCARCHWHFQSDGDAGRGDAAVQWLLAPKATSPCIRHCDISLNRRHARGPWPTRLCRGRNGAGVAAAGQYRKPAFDRRILLRKYTNRRSIASRRDWKRKAVEVIHFHAPGRAARALENWRQPVS